MNQREAKKNVLYWLAQVARNAELDFLFGNAGEADGDRLMAARDQIVDELLARCGLEGFDFSPSLSGIYFGRMVDDVDPPIPGHGGDFGDSHERRD